MNNKDLMHLENRFQEIMLRKHTVDELFSIDEDFFSYLTEKLKQNSNDVPTLIHLGVLSWEPFHRQEEAIAYLEKAIAYDPKNVEARFWLAKCYYHDYCAYEKVRQILLEALQIDSKKPECLALLAAVIMDTTKALEEAIYYYEQAVHYAPDWPMTRHSLARLYLQKKDVLHAEMHIQQIFSYFKPSIKQPKNSIEEYYESVVTGRNWPNIREEFAGLLTKLEQIKKENRNV